MKLTTRRKKILRVFYVVLLSVVIFQIIMRFYINGMMIYAGWLTQSLELKGFGMWGLESFIMGGIIFWALGLAIKKLKEKP